MAKEAFPHGLRWAIVGVVVVVALVIGSGVLTPKPTTAQARAASLETRLKCPGCMGLSVAESASASSLAVRRQVVVGIAAGKSDAEITAQLEARYGNTVLLTPPSGGLTDALWLVPVALGIGIVATMVVLARRRNLGTSKERSDVRA